MMPSLLDEIVWSDERVLSARALWGVYTTDDCSISTVKKRAKNDSPTCTAMDLDLHRPAPADLLESLVRHTCSPVPSEAPP